MAVRNPIFAMLSDRGRVRRNNEDACAASPSAGIFVVCDGMGGAAGGEVASHLAAETFLAHMARREPVARVPVRISAAVQAANRAIYSQAQRTPNLSGMGTTLVGLLYPGAQNGANGSTGEPSENSGIWLVHVGDSRCYLWREGHLRQLTRDHSLVEEQVLAGQITPQQAEESPMRNILTRAVGSHAVIEPEIQCCRPQEGDLYLLATDGLTRELSEEEIAAFLPQNGKMATQAALYGACGDLIRAANAKGGADNITVLMVVVGR
ncbi:PP2C family protein-serine/threonine phosphatase [Edaphobacter albus]|uniref:PP2C family protein-serine/threonine phosphatase n=1 Tax=Edaphobacter sp. 4G125 TaxID=2763071 RepID=UPI0016447F39|nr:PP2C family serine/threonine-protein phosphatase [Edaphobacter sp. 4G125]QNI37565.1 serine/threonine-protein phosphatase [Edaphobacter sp. 4G125]